MKIKYRNLRKMFGVLFVMISLSGFVQSQPLSKGSIAPTFSSEATRAGKEFHFSMKDAVAKGPVVVYFFPSAYTGGCDLEAHTFATLIDKFKEAGTTVIGISADDIQRLNSFSADPDFCAGTFPIASDPDGKIAAEFGLKMAAARLGAKDVRGIEINHGFIPRTTFVINKNGKVETVFSSATDGISPDEHVKKSLAIVQQLK